MNKRMCLNTKERSEVKRIIKEKTGYLITSTSILDQIFKRSSFAAENGQNSNEIFEFIGDQVLGFYAVKIISERCGSLSLITDDYTFRIRENQFTAIKQALVNNETLAKITEEWDIAKYLLLGKSDIKNEVAKETKVKADLLEAVIGAIAVESNWNSEVLETAVLKTLNIDKEITNMIESDIKVKLFDIDNAVTVLKELSEKGRISLWEYEFTGPEYIGYDSDGNPNWCCSCSIVNDETAIRRTVFANSKKGAKKAVAYLLLCELFCVQNKYGPNDWFMVWFYKDGKLIPKCKPDRKEN